MSKRIMRYEYFWCSKGDDEIVAEIISLDKQTFPAIYIYIYMSE